MVVYIVTSHNPINKLKLVYVTVPEAGISQMIL
jgi:hypothetical protein